MKILLITGIIVYFLSRFSVVGLNGDFNDKGWRIKFYFISIILAEIITISVIVFQLFVDVWAWSLIEPYQSIGFLIFLAGVFISVWGRKELKNNWRTARCIAKPKILVDTGPYKYVRHPIYIGSLLMGIGFEMTLASYFLIIVLTLGTAFIINCMRQEEYFLTSWFKEYEEYKQKTKLPF
ncbi:isoprenylcysteine carboxylmethyltransferase family protein [Patescibacteria group bacterium]|nr:isoprenylcysteine carboxylmethyltransferase family protein [Patescibacteria group bacterium]